MEGYFDLTLGDQLIMGKNDVDVSKYTDHLEQKDKEWNAAFSEYENTKGIKFCSKALIDQAIKAPYLLEGRVPIMEWLRGIDKDGTVYNNQIQTTVLVLHTILNNPGKSGIVMGPTMCGKTGTSNNCQFLAPIMTLLTGKKHVLVNLLPNKKSIQEQARDDWRRFWTFYSDILIKYKKSLTTFNKFYNELGLSNGPMQMLYPLCDDRSSGGGNIQRRSKSTMEILEKANKHRKDKEIRYIFLTDEIHDAARKNSIQARIYTELSHDLLAEQKGDIIIGFSATPWQSCNLSNVWMVYHKLTDLYCGLNIYNGVEIDPEVTCSRPLVYNPSQFHEKSGIDLSFISRSAFRDSSRFQKIKEKQRKKEQQRKQNIVKEGEPDLRKFNSHHEYKKTCFKSIAESINWCLIKQKPCGKIGKGLFLRFCTNNYDLIAFEEGLKKNGVHKSIKFLTYAGNNVKNKIYKVIMSDEHVKSGKPYVILLTGAGRMADRLPVEVKYYFDYTEQSNDTAILQGTYGRATGNNKGNPPPWVILTHKVAEQLKTYIKNNGVPYKKPHIDAVLVPKNGELLPAKTKSVQSIVMTKEHAKKNAKLLSVWNYCEKEIAGSIPKNNKRPRGNFFPNMWGVQFDEEFLTELENLFSEDVKILRPNELDDKGWGWARKTKDKSACKIGFRTADSTSSKNSNCTSSDRELPGGQKRDEENRYRLEMQMHVFPPKKQGRGMTPWKLAKIRFRLKEETKIHPNSLNGIILPNSRNYWDNHATPAERKKSFENSNS